jgi:hypothetical protein
MPYALLPVAPHSSLPPPPSPPHSSLLTLLRPPHPHLPHLPHLLTGCAIVATVATLHTLHTVHTVHTVVTTAIQHRYECLRHTYIHTYRRASTYRHTEHPIYEPTSPTLTLTILLSHYLTILPPCGGRTEPQ